MTDDANATTKRGSGTWRYLQVVLGFALTIEAVVVEMIKPIEWPYNVATFVIVAAFTIWIFLRSDRLHYRLLHFKDSFDDRVR
jgi:hypothetical protein